MDGLMYACVSKNLANGIGTFWFPKFSELGFAGNTTFHEHPPLVFGIQAMFFKILGNSIYVERLYSFMTACITAYLITRLWKLLTNDEQKVQELIWLPVLFWIIIPVSFWSYQNNVQENTMGIFTLLAVYYSLKGLYSTQGSFFYLLFSGFFIFLASFSKGVPGLFPIAVIGLYWLISRNIPFSKMLLYTAILIFTPVVIYLLLLINSEAFESLSIYVTKRLLGRIESAPTVDYRFYIVQRLFMELLPVLAITFIMLIIYKLKSIKKKFK
ncbi:MAG: glycosyltransferase family 39 protein, partial [Bacteroidetes bacterium]|nr:glycosyltransferase family 39 protein [Bacteroidota bacterium]